MAEVSEHMIENKPLIKQVDALHEGKVATQRATKEKSTRETRMRREDFEFLSQTPTIVESLRKHAVVLNKVFPVSLTVTDPASDPRYPITTWLGLHTPFVEGGYDTYHDILEVGTTRKGAKIHGVSLKFLDHARELSLEELDQFDTHVAELLNNLDLQNKRYERLKRIPYDSDKIHYHIGPSKPSPSIFDRRISLLDEVTQVDLARRDAVAPGGIEKYRKETEERKRKREKQRKEDYKLLTEKSVVRLLLAAQEKINIPTTTLTVSDPGNTEEGHYPVSVELAWHTRGQWVQNRPSGGRAPGSRTIIEDAPLHQALIVTTDRDGKSGTIKGIRVDIGDDIARPDGHNNHRHEYGMAFSRKIPLEELNRLPGVIDQALERIDFDAMRSNPTYETGALPYLGTRLPVTSSDQHK